MHHELDGVGPVDNRPTVVKRKPIVPHGVHLFLRLSAKFVQYSATFLCLNMKVRMNLENIIFIACK